MPDGKEKWSLWDAWNAISLRAFRTPVERWPAKYRAGTKTIEKTKNQLSDDVRLYLTRLAELLTAKVAQGVYSNEEGLSLYASATKELEGKTKVQPTDSKGNEMPYYEETIGGKASKWFDFIAEQKTSGVSKVGERTKGRTANESYLSNLNAYLSSWGMGLSRKEVQDAVANERTLLGQGYDVTGLPNYQGVQSYTQGTQGTAQGWNQESAGRLAGEGYTREGWAAGQEMAQATQGMFNRISEQSNLQENLRKQWDTIRGDIVGGLQSPANWIQRYQAENAINPYDPQDANLGKRIEQLQVEVDQYQVAAEGIQKRMKDPNDRLTLFSILNPRTPEEQSAAAILNAYNNSQQQLNEIEAQRVSEAQMWTSRGYDIRGGFPGGAVSEAKPETPLAPDWLSQYVPGLKAGQPITKQRMATPSPQQWRTTPLAQQQMLQGYTEWQGTPWADIAQQYQNMLPNTPNIASRWQPQRQRI